MAGIVSKNPFDLLGNDPELDPDREPEPPTKALDKPVPRSGKRNAGGEAPAGRGGARGRGGTRGGAGDAVTGNEQAFRDRGAGSAQNRSHPPDGEGRHSDRPRGEYRGRGRGSRGRGAPRGDRHPNRTGITNDHEKSAEQSWGANTGEAELADEKAGEVIAKEDEKDGAAATAAATTEASGNDEAADDEAKAEGDGEAAEEGPKQVSYETYLAEQARKKLDLGSGPLEARKPNEGSKQKFEGKEFKRSEGEESFFAGSGPKTKRERAQKDKQKVDLEGQFYRPPETEGGRGGRGGRGSRAGGSRGGLPPRGRGEGAPKAGGRGGRGSDRGGGGEFRGGRGGRGPSGPNVDDQKAFPSLGS